jgi:Holliday junction resolvase
MNSKQKGNRGEREWAAFCREQGFDCRRGQQYNGLEGEDVIGLPYMHQEVKRVEKLNIQDALDQSEKDMCIKYFGPELKDMFPIVAHRRNNEKWKVTMYADDWFNLYKEWYSGKKLIEQERGPVS